MDFVDYDQPLGLISQKRIGILEAPTVRSPLEIEVERVGATRVSNSARERGLAHLSWSE